MKQFVGLILISLLFSGCICKHLCNKTNSNSNSNNNLFPSGDDIKADNDSVDIYKLSLSESKSNPEIVKKEKPVDYEVTIRGGSVHIAGNIEDSCIVSNALENDSVLASKLVELNDSCENIYSISLIKPQIKIDYKIFDENGTQIDPLEIIESDTMDIYFVCGLEQYYLGFHDIDGKSENFSTLEKFEFDLRENYKNTFLIAGFETGKKDISTEMEDSIKSIAEHIKRRQCYKITVSGHTDSIPCRQNSDITNTSLALARADSVKSHLIKLGVDGNKIHTGVGNKPQYYYSNVTSEGRDKNRGVSIIIKQTEEIESDENEKSDTVKSNRINEIASINDETCLYTDYMLRINDSVYYVEGGLFFKTKKLNNLAITKNNYNIESSSNNLDSILSLDQLIISLYLNARLDLIQYSYYADNIYHREVKDSIKFIEDTPSFCDSCDFNKKEISEKKREKLVRKGEKNYEKHLNDPDYKEKNENKLTRINDRKEKIEEKIEEKYTKGKKIKRLCTKRNKKENRYDRCYLWPGLYFEHGERASEKYQKIIELRDSLFSKNSNLDKLITPEKKLVYLREFNKLIPLAMQVAYANYYNYTIKFPDNIKANEILNTIFRFMEASKAPLLKAKLNPKSISIDDVQGKISESNRNDSSGVVALVEYYFTDDLIYSIIITQNDKILIEPKPNDKELLKNAMSNKYGGCSIREFNTNYNKLYNLLFLTQGTILNELHKVYKRIIIVNDNEIATISFDIFTKDTSLNQLVSQPLLIFDSINFSYQISCDLLFSQDSSRKKTEDAETNYYNDSLFDYLGIAPSFKDQYKRDIPCSDSEVFYAIDSLGLFGDTLIDENATKNNVLKLLNENRYKIIHFSTHGEDSLLFLYDDTLSFADIEKLKLYETELVILSACNSGTGDILDGEGIISLARAFQLAGVKNILVTLKGVRYSNLELCTENCKCLLIKSFLRFNKNNCYSESLFKAKLTNKNYEDYPFFILYENIK